MIDIGILVSGNGSNLQAIIDSIEAGKLDAAIKVVVSDQANAYALQRAKKHSIPTTVITKKEYPDKKSFDEKVVATLKESNVELVCLAGFMRIITPVFLDAFPMKIINIHPSLLPSFPGLNVQKKAIEHGVKFSGCTVHFVDEGVDSGAIILQAVVPVLDNDTTENLKERILAEEHRVYPKAIGLIAKERLELKGRRVLIKE